MVFRKRVDPEIEETAKEVRRILGLKEDLGEVRVVYGSAPSSDEEIALLTRSIVEVLTDISSTVEVPAEHVAEKRVHATMEPAGTGIRGPMIRILWSKRSRTTTLPPFLIATAGSGSTTGITSRRSSSRS